MNFKKMIRKTLGDSKKNTHDALGGRNRGGAEMKRYSE